MRKSVKSITCEVCTKLSKTQNALNTTDILGYSGHDVRTFLSMQIFLASFTTDIMHLISIHYQELGEGSEIEPVIGNLDH